MEKQLQQELLNVQNLKINFQLKDGKVAKVVEDVSFTIYKGETVALVGESGSGKSITSLAIMGLLSIPPGEIVGGKIIFNGENLLDYKQKDMSKVRGNDISMIFQEPMTSLDPVFTISNQLIEGIRRHQKVSKKEAWKSRFTC